jgi:hypothetical protein
VANGGSTIGTVIADLEIWVGNTSANLVFDHALYTNPPEGYYSVKMTGPCGSWRHDPAQ